jgi:hypothetical protein
MARKPTRKLNDDEWRKLLGHKPRQLSRWCYPADFEPERTEPPVVKWRKAVLGPDGPPSGTTRFVLLTLSAHMNEEGGSCFPSVELLAKETRLSKRAVMRHIQFAVAEGWLDRTEAMGQGKGWMRAEYQATVPMFGGDARSPRSQHRRRRDKTAADGGDRDAPSW